MRRYVQKYVNDHLAPNAFSRHRGRPLTRFAVFFRPLAPFMILFFVYAVPYFRSVFLWFLLMLWVSYFVWSMTLFKRLKKSRITAFEYFLYESFIWLFLSIAIWTAMMTIIITSPEGNLVLEGILLILGIIGTGVFIIVKLANRRISSIKKESEPTNPNNIGSEKKSNKYEFLAALVPLGGAVGFLFARWFFGTGIVPDDVIQSTIFAGAVVAILTLIFFFIAFDNLHLAYLVWKHKLFNIKV